MQRLFLFLLFSLPFFVSAQSYDRLHRKATVIDTHNDVLSQVILEGHNMEHDLRGIAHSDLRRFREGGVDAQIFSVFCDERYGKGQAFAYANRQIDSLYAVIGRNPGRMALVGTPGELRRAVREGKLACMIGVEGGHMIEDERSYLDSLFRRGARYLTLTWNNSTSWATSAADETKRKDSLPFLGLNELGRTIVRRMNELGMLVDLSHVGERTFWDVMKITTKPVLVSHSCAWTLCPVPRNLKDDQIREIGRNGGVIHLNFYSGFLDSTFDRRRDAFLSAHRREIDSLRALKRADYEIDAWFDRSYPSEWRSLRAPIALVVDHIDHIVRLIGVDHVGLGSDFDGISSPPQLLDDVSTFPLLTRELRRRGYSKGEVRKILGGNFLRLFEAQGLR